MKNGFTLVELSIVLVIIGLLIGGVLVGQGLIESAKINSQISQLRQFDIAANQFYQKFNCIPGDCTYFSPQPGDGNGILGTGGGIPAASPLYEHYNFFRVMVDEDYLRLGHEIPVSSASHIIGVNYPDAAIGRGGISTNSLPNGDIYYFLGFNIDSEDGNDRHYYRRSTAGIAALPREEAVKAYDEINLKFENYMLNEGGSLAVKEALDNFIGHPDDFLKLHTERLRESGMEIDDKGFLTNGLDGTSFTAPYVAGHIGRVN